MKEKKEIFEINEYNSLTAYYNSDRNITEITVPEGVKYILFRVFEKYKKLDIVTLPDSIKYIESSAFWNADSPCSTNVRSIIYRGVTFRPTIDSLYIADVIDMIANKNYSYILSHNLKYPIILQVYFNDGDDVTTAYIKKNFKKFFIFLTDEIIFQNKCGFKGLYFEYIEDVSEIMKKLISCGKFITKRNINTYIRYADEHECYEVFDMLEEYREENNF